MAQMKLALDNETERELLLDLWKIEELVEQDKKKKALKAIKELIKEVRYSEIIDSYTLFDATDGFREEDLLDTIASTIRNTPNDMELGGEIRKLFSV